MATFPMEVNTGLAEPPLKANGRSAIPRLDISTTRQAAKMPIGQVDFEVFFQIIYWWVNARKTYSIFNTLELRLSCTNPLI